jgi:hypothetical protein
VGFREETLTALAARVPRPLINRVKRVVAAPVAWNLHALAAVWGADKARHQHGYTTHYARYLKRRSVRCVLEVGIGGYEDPAVGGSSLLMWRSYFPNATIYGLDLYEKRIEAPRVVVRQGDQSDPGSLERAVAGCPPFDLIVDDGSHLASHTLTTFETLFPKLKPGGIYAVEDLWYAYRADYEGGPPGTPGTHVELIRGLVDRTQAGSGARDIAELHVFNNLALIRKAMN